MNHIAHSLDHSLDLLAGKLPNRHHEMIHTETIWDRDQDLHLALHHLDTRLLARNRNRTLTTPSAEILPTHTSIQQWLTSDLGTSTTILSSARTLSTSLLAEATLY